MADPIELSCKVLVIGAGLGGTCAARVASSSCPDVLVVSKGDDELLKLGGCKAWHFPQTGQGVYAGYYPADSAAAIAQLEALRAKGGQFLLFPSTAFWWLGHYEDFRHHLDARCGRIWGDEQCVIYQLSRSCEPQPGLMRRTLSHLSMVRTKVHWR